MKVGSIVRNITSFSPSIYNDWSYGQQTIGYLERDSVSIVLEIIVDSYNGQDEIIAKVLNCQQIGWLKAKFLKEI